MTHKDKLSPKLSRADIFVLMACLFSTGLCFAASVGFDFVSWDDPLFITKNPLVTATGNTLSDWCLTPTLGYPIPITVFTYWVEYQLVGDAPWLFHLNNLIIHLLSVGLLFVLARRLGLSTPAAALTTLLFALHPVVVEPVCWATGRKDLLAGFFGLSAGMMFLSGPPPSIRSRRCWLAAGLFFVRHALKAGLSFLASPLRPRTTPQI